MDNYEERHEKRRIKLKKRSAKLREKLCAAKVKTGVLKAQIAKQKKARASHLQVPSQVPAPVPGTGTGLAPVALELVVPVL